MTLALSYWLELGAAAVLTSIVSGVMGMAGGMLLLALMLLALEPAAAIPVHGIVQLVSNGSRANFLRSHVRWPAVWRFAWPLLPGGALGICCCRCAPSPAPPSVRACSTSYRSGRCALS